MKFKANLHCLIVIIVSFSSTTFAGGWNGGGDDRPWEADAAWYLTRKGVPATIRYCLEVAPQFPLSEANVSELVANSFRRWFSYISERGINDSILRRGNLLVTEARKIAGCDGSQDLKMSFGTTSASIEHEKARYHDPIGFAVSGKPTRPHTNPLGNWYGNGFIWISSDRVGIKKLDEYYSLETEIIIMHELGHIFGNGYVSGTIMDQNIGRFLTVLRNNGYYRYSSDEKDLKVLKRLREIDGSRDLAMCLSSCRSQTFRDVVIYDRREKLAKIFGVKVSDIPEADTLTIDGDPSENVTITLKSATKMLKLDLGKPQNVIHVPLQTNVFRIMGYNGSAVRNNDDSSYQVARILFFQKELDGRRISLEISQNVVQHFRMSFSLGDVDAGFVLIASDEPDYRSF